MAFLKLAKKCPKFVAGRGWAREIDYLYPDFAAGRQPNCERCEVSVAAYNTAYERTQNYNWLTAFLHGRRYRNLIATLDRHFGRQPFRMLDIGCNTANIFAAIGSRFEVDYIGVDPDAESIAVAKTRFGRTKNFRAECRSAIDGDWLASNGPYDVVTALETLEHISQPEVLCLLKIIRSLQPLLFVCSAPVEIGPIVIIKNFGSPLMGYNRRQEYTAQETLHAACYRLDEVRPHQRGHRGFDWRWLANAIRDCLGEVEITNMPLAFLPSALSTNKFMITTLR
jgi:SAM-dependent methyltransferase